MLASPGGLNGRVERQQVGLLGDIVDRLDDGADAIAQRAELLNARRGVADDGLDLGHGRGGFAHRGGAVLG